MGYGGFLRRCVASLGGLGEGVEGRLIGEREQVWILRRMVSLLGRM